MTQNETLVSNKRPAGTKVLSSFANRFGKVKIEKKLELTTVRETVVSEDDGPDFPAIPKPKPGETIPSPTQPTQVPTSTPPLEPTAPASN